jgi:hypothetical protein
MRIAVICSNDGTDVRIGKTCRSLVRLGYDVHFVGWDRRPALAKQIDLPDVHCHILKWETERGRSCLTGEVRYSWHVLQWLWRLRPKVVCAVNEENALRVMPLKKLCFQHLVCDIFDGLADRMAGRARWSQALLSVAARAARSRADRLIVTDERRFARVGSHQAKTEIIANYPETREGFTGQPLRTGPIRIYVAGSLSRARGLPQILSVAERLEHVVITSAGWLYDSFASEQFAPHPKVDFRGILTARQSLELAAECDAVFAFYSPHSVNNVLASPNKVYDAMLVGRPLIINSEAEVSEWVTSEGFGFRCPYEDEDGLLQIVRSLASHRLNLPAFAAHSQRRLQGEFCWERMEERLGVLYGGLTAARNRYDKGIRKAA